MARHITSRLRASGRILRSDKTRAALSLGVVLGLGTVGTLAYWTDTATLTGGTFTAGTLDIKLDGSDNGSSAFESAFTMTNMQPGDSKAAVVSVQNAGDVAFTYTAQGRATGALRSYLKVSVYPGGTKSGDTCIGAPSSFSSTLGAAYGPVSSANRPVAPAAAESFCVVAKLPEDTTDGQGLSTTAEFVFDAKQVGAP